MRAHVDRDACFIPVTFSELGIWTGLRRDSIDIDTCKMFKEELQGLIDTGRLAILVDFSGVDFMTSAGLGILVAFRKRVEEVSGKLALCSLNENIREVFDTVGFTQFFQIYSDSKGALAGMS